MKLRNLLTGQVLLREGDPAGPIYIVCSGSLRVYRRDYTAVDNYVDLAMLGTGAVLGEMAAILGRPRSATVQAVESSKVLEIQPQELPRLGEQHLPLVRVITSSVSDRAGLPFDEVADLIGKLGVVVPATLATEIAAQESQTPNNQDTAVPANEPSAVYPKMIDCPVCGVQFGALTLRARRDVPAKRESDFHNLYETAYNPYDYELWVCPNDLYAALPVDFPDLAEKHQQFVVPTVEAVVGKWGDDVPDFSGDRSFKLRERGLELALALYTMRDLSPVRLAAVTHRLAWCAREQSDTVAEMLWLEQALEHYTRAFEQTDLGGAKEELRVQYLCGEITLRLGDAPRASAWFTGALSHPAVKQHGNWERLLRDQLGVAREIVTAEAPAT